jgi:hypothetical protein
MKPRGNRLPGVLASALFAAGWALAAQAAQPVAAKAPGTALATSETVFRDEAEAKISDATRALEQAALQANVASDARELELLQRAHDDLSTAVGQLHGTRRIRAGWLLSDLEQAMQRASVQLGTLISPGEEGFDQVVPDRNQLAALATEAQELERREQTVHRLIGTTIIGLALPSQNASMPPRSPLDVENTELLSWPLGYETAGPQINIGF